MPAPYHERWDKSKQEQQQRTVAVGAIVHVHIVCEKLRSSCKTQHAQLRRRM
jgi:hypothetical protein